MDFSASMEAKNYWNNSSQVLMENRSARIVYFPKLLFKNKSKKEIFKINEKWEFTSETRIKGTPKWYMGISVWNRLGVFTMETGVSPCSAIASCGASGEWVSISVLQFSHL